MSRILARLPSLSTSNPVFVVLRVFVPSCFRPSILPPMIKFYKFRPDLFSPVAGREIQHKPGKGKGWPEECPPIRGANGFGFDLLANFDREFQFARGNWTLKKPIIVQSDFEWSPDEEIPGAQLTQEYAWFWEKGQKLP